MADTIIFAKSLAAALLLMAAATALHADEPKPIRPNVLIIVADDMGFSDAGCTGGDIATPNLDRLAKDGLLFTQFYNTARCWPSRAAILTGYYAQQVRRDTGAEPRPHDKLPIVPPRRLGETLSALGISIRKRPA